LSIVNSLALEAHHKISRRTHKSSTSFDGGRSDAPYYLPKDKNLLFKKQQKNEPTSLLQALELTYALLLIRLKMKNEVAPPTYSITFPRFKHPTYSKEFRFRKNEKGA
jgi:hypothetical protein